MANFFEELLDLDSIGPQANRRWPSLKVAVDTLRSLPILALFATGLGVLYKSGDLLGQICFWVMAPILLLLIFCSVLQAATLFLVLFAGLISEVRGVKPGFFALRSNHPAIFKFISTVLALVLTYAFIILTIRLLAAVRFAG